MNFLEIEKNFISKILKENCKQITNLYLSFDFFLYHGKSKNENFIILDNIKYRNPKDTKKEIHDLIDKAMKDLNFKATRSNSLFCTSNETEAKKYGSSIFVVFPYDNFYYSYSPFIPDFTEFSEELITLVNNEYYEEFYLWGFEVKNSNIYGFNIDGDYIVNYFLQKYFLEEVENIVKEFYNSNKKFYVVRDLLKDYPNFFDFYSFKNKELAIKIKKLVEEYGKKNVKDIENNDEFFRLLKLKIESLYKDNNIIDAVDKEVEIMINSEKFLLVNSKILKTTEDLDNLLK